MALDQAENFVRGRTATSTDSTQTSLDVEDASLFPDPSGDEYNAVLWDADQYPRPDQDPNVEIVRVTARDTGTNTLTVTRGQEGTAGASHPSGSALQMSPTAKMFNDIEARYVADGEDFDGQGASAFSGLASVNGADLANATDESLPFSQGDGTLSMERFFYRQSSAPASAPDGAVWVTEVDGAGNDTTSRYVRDAVAGQWELESAVGPSEPSLGTPVAGAMWRDTSTGNATQYDGSDFVFLSPSATGPRWVKPIGLDEIDSVNVSFGAENLVDGDTSTYVSFSSNGSFGTYQVGYVVAGIRIYPTQVPDEAQLRANVGVTRNVGTSETISPTVNTWNEYSLPETGDGFDIGIPNSSNQTTDLHVAEVEIKRAIPPEK